MGRTVPSMTQQILDEMQSWSQFRRALRAEDREVFDELFRSVRIHVAEISMAARLLPFEAMLLSMLVDQGVRLKTMEKILLQQGRVGERVVAGLSSASILGPSVTHPLPSRSVQRGGHV